MKIFEKKSISELQQEIEELEKDIEEQTVKNIKVKKRNNIIRISVFGVVVVITIIAYIYLSKENDKRIEDYRIQAEEQIKVYEQEIEALQQEIDSIE